MSMREKATVVDVDGDRVRVVFERPSVCRGCGVCTGRDVSSCSLELKNSIGARLGDRVLVVGEMSDLAAAALLYGVPSVLFVAGLSVGVIVFHSEALAFLTGLVFFLGYVKGIPFFEKRYRPRIEKEDPLLKE